MFQRKKKICREREKEREKERKRDREKGREREKERERRIWMKNIAYWEKNSKIEI